MVEEDKGKSRRRRMRGRSISSQIGGNALLLFPLSLGPYSRRTGAEEDDRKLEGRSKRGKKGCFKVRQDEEEEEELKKNRRMNTK